MANKRKLHHRYVLIKRVSFSFLLMLFVASTLTSLLALRNNNLTMVRLRDQVFIADEAGEGVEEALDALRSHVYAHMNTDLSSGGLSIYPPIQLKHTYDRLTEKEQQRVAAQNKKVSAQATATCEARFPAGQIQERARCVQEYITKNSAKQKPVPKELYQFAFVSPRWSADLAGIMLAVSAALFVLLVLKLGLELYYKHVL